MKEEKRGRCMVWAKGKVGSMSSLRSLREFDSLTGTKFLVRNARWWYLKASTLACHNNLMEKFITLAANMKCSCGVTGYVPPKWVLCALSQDVPWLVAEIWIPFEYYLCSTLRWINAGKHKQRRPGGGDRMTHYGISHRRTQYDITNVT